MSWWRLYLHVLLRIHRMCVVRLDDGSFHYFCSCGVNNEGKTFKQVWKELYGHA